MLTHSCTHKEMSVRWLEGIVALSLWRCPSFSFFYQTCIITCLHRSTCLLFSAQQLTTWWTVLEVETRFTFLCSFTHIFGTLDLCRYLRHIFLGLPCSYVFASALSTGLGCTPDVDTNLTQPLFIQQRVVISRRSIMWTIHLNSLH